MVPMGGMQSRGSQKVTFSAADLRRTRGNQVLRINVGLCVGGFGQNLGRSTGPAQPDEGMTGPGQAPFGPTPPVTFPSQNLFQTGLLNWAVRKHTVRHSRRTLVASTCNQMTCEHSTVRHRPGQLLNNLSIDQPRLKQYRASCSLAPFPMHTAEIRSG